MQGRHSEPHRLTSGSHRWGSELGAHGSALEQGGAGQEAGQAFQLCTPGLGAMWLASGHGSLGLWDTGSLGQRWQQPLVGSAWGVPAVNVCGHVCRTVGWPFQSPWSAVFPVRVDGHRPLPSRVSSAHGNVMMKRCQPVRPSDQLSQGGQRSRRIG